MRNYFLMRFPVTEQQGIYDGLWLPMQNRLGLGLTEFMRHFLGAEGEDVRKGDVYAAIKRLVTDSDSASVRFNDADGAAFRAIWEGIGCGR